MFRKLGLALVVASLTTGSALAQFGSKKGVKPSAPLGNALHANGVAKGVPVSPGNSQKGIIAILTGLAKEPAKAPLAKSAVPGPVPLKEQIEKRKQQLGVKVRNGLKNHK